MSIQESLSWCGHSLEPYQRHARNTYALNVKYSKTLRLTPETAAKYNALPKFFQEQCAQRAQDTVSENWWDWATAQAKTHDLGTIYSAGRSGGWLIFAEDPKFRSYLDEVDAVCAHCDLRWDEHAESACLFDSTVFMPGDHYVQQLFNALISFAKEITASLIDLNYEYEQEVLYYLENLDDDNTAAIVSCNGATAHSCTKSNRTPTHTGLE